jgi:hypothetical protein
MRAIALLRFQLAGQRRIRERAAEGGEAKRSRADELGDCLEFSLFQEQNPHAARCRNKTAAHRPAVCSKCEDKENANGTILERYQEYE